MKEKTTGELMEGLMEASSFSEYLTENQDDMEERTVAQLLNDHMESKGLQRSQVAKASGINEIYAYQVLSGTRVPSRDKLLCLGIAMQLTVDEIQELLNRGGYAQLYPRKKRDAAILFALKSKPDILTVNEILFTRGEKTLC